MCICHQEACCVLCGTQCGRRIPKWILVFFLDELNYITPLLVIYAYATKKHAVSYMVLYVAGGVPNGYLFSWWFKQHYSMGYILCICHQEACRELCGTLCVRQIPNCILVFFLDDLNHITLWIICVYATKKYAMCFVVLNVAGGFPDGYLFVLFCAGGAE